MYRNYYLQKRNCCSYNNTCNKDNCKDIIEDTCEYAQNFTDTNNNYECGFDEEKNIFPSDPMFAQSYVPWQTMDQSFLPSVGLKMGTIFPELVSPYMPGDSMREIEYIRNKNVIVEEDNR